MKNTKMKNTKLSFEGMSHNLQYVFTNRGVVKLSEQLNDLNGKNYLSYTYNNLNVAIDIMKENFDFKFKTGQLDLVEYAAAPRKFLANIIEIYRPENSITLIKEWENIFGGDLLLINESVDRLIIESRITESWESFKVLLEQWYNPADWARGLGKGIKNAYDYGNEKFQKFTKWGASQINQIQQKGIWNYAKEKGAALWDTVKNAVKSAYKCLRNNFVECLMEGIRDVVMSAGGIAVLTGISMIPAIGQIPTVIIFGALLLWDLYKMASGKYESGGPENYQWDVWDIVIDAISLLLPALGKVVKGLGGNIKTFAQFGKQAISKGGVLLKVFNAIQGGIAKLGGYIAKAATWLGEKLGMTSMKNWGSKATAQLSKITDDMVAGGGGKITTKVASKIKPASVGQKTKDFLNKAYRPALGNEIPATGVIVKSMRNTFLVTTAICAALGLNGATCTQKIESGEVTPEQYEAAKKQADIDMSKAMEADDSGLDLMSL